MKYTIELDAQSLQIIGEALALAPMAARATQPVLNSIQQQIVTQEQIAKAVAETQAARTATDPNHTPRPLAPESKRRGRKPKQNGKAEGEQPAVQ